MQVGARGLVSRFKIDEESASEEEELPARKKG
jgi:hypothetical protein